MNGTDSSALARTIPEALAPYESSEKTALICGDAVLSYRELLADARRVAQALVLRGVRKGDRVVLSMGRSADYMRLYLGIIYAGAVQVTLHSGWPERQRARVLADCAPALTVDDAEARAICAAPPCGAALPELSGGDPFQIVYTSGSTGEPKGVVNCHQLALTTQTDPTDRSAQALAFRRFSEQSHRVLMDANPAFGMASGVYFRAFLHENTLILATEQEVETPYSLAGCIRRTGADNLHSIASRFLSFLEEPAFADALSGVRLLNFSGEPANERVFDALEASGAQIRYTYASTETMICLLSPPCHRGEPVCYDSPFPSLPVWLLDEDGTEEVPDGEVGELCVGGCAGQYGQYWNDPALTAEKYWEHPRYGRLFRTGDSARRTPGGQIEILGRMDSMAKLHGQRIELLAVESAMEAFPGVRRAAAVIQGEGPAAALCGFYCGSVEEGALRRALAQTLPWYMVPALLRELPALPLNVNGKLDRRALPVLRAAPQVYTPPETERERLLCAVFSRALRRDTPVGIDESFFALGGDSMRGMAAGALLREQGLAMKLEWLFAAPTVRALAPMLLPLEERETPWTAQLSHADWERVDRAVGRERAEAVYPALLYARAYLRRGSLWRMCALALIPRRLSGSALRARWKELQRAHTALRSVFVGVGEERPLQVVRREADCPFFEVDLRALSDGETGRLSPRQESYLRTLISLHRERQPDPEREVLFHLGLIHLGEGCSALFCFYSHLLLDAAGLSRIMEELLGDEPVPSDARPFARQMQRLSTGAQDGALEHWRQMTDGAERFTALPKGDGPAPFVHHQVVSGAALLRRAVDFCRSRRVTLSTLLHLAAGETLMELLGLCSVSFASTASGRDAASAGLVGMFLWHFPVLIRRGETLGFVQERVLAGMRYGVPDEKELPPEMWLPGMNGVFTLNVENALESVWENAVPALMRGDRRFAAAESAACGPPPGIDGALTLMVRLDGQFDLDFYYSPASVDRVFVKRFASAMLTRLRRMVEGNG